MLPRRQESPLVVQPVPLPTLLAPPHAEVVGEAERADQTAAFAAVGAGVWTAERPKADEQSPRQHPESGEGSHRTRLTAESSSWASSSARTSSRREIRALSDRRAKRSSSLNG